jgi:alpha-beta hydrolase superfamily lysophospholipase
MMVFKALGLLLVLLFSGLLLLYFNQERLLFYPERLSAGYSFQFPNEFQEANLELSGGEFVNYLVFNASSTKGILLYFHGNAGSLASWGFVADELAQRTGWCVWMMDYPGFGKSSGALPKTEKILFEMGHSILAEVRKVNPQPPTVLFGRSVGTGIASDLAAKTEVAGLVLESPYRSIAKLGHEIFPLLPESFSRFHLDNESVLKVLKDTPIAIFHGSSDEVIPVAHGRFLSGLQSPLKYVEIKNGFHNNLSDFSDYWTELQLFLEPIANSKP